MTAEKFIEKNYINGCGDWMLDTVLKEFATLKCQQLLEIVAEKAQVTDFGYAVSRYSIMNAVNLDEFIN